MLQPAGWTRTAGHLHKGHSREVQQCLPGTCPLPLRLSKAWTHPPVTSSPPRTPLHRTCFPPSASVAQPALPSLHPHAGSLPVLPECHPSHPHLSYVTHGSLGRKPSLTWKTRSDHSRAGTLDTSVTVSWGSSPASPLAPVPTPAGSAKLALPSHLGGLHPNTRAAPSWPYGCHLPFPAVGHGRAP